MWTQTIWMLAASALLAACSQPAVQVQADQSAICDALRPAMPIQFHSKSDTPNTVARIQQANARYQAACG